NYNDEDDEGMNMGRKSKPRFDPELNDQIERAADVYLKRMQAGERIGAETIVEDLMSSLFKRDVPQLGANINLAKLYVQVPRVRIPNSFRPALLSEKREVKYYENLPLGMLTNGYSKAQIQRALQTLDLPYSEVHKQGLVEVIH
ncbi:MAG: hypothetical protein QW837_05835, partial [Conexivisphaerales archaeon]